MSALAAIDTARGPEADPAAEVVRELQRKVAGLRSSADEHDSAAEDSERCAAEERNAAAEFSAAADRWQTVLDLYTAHTAGPGDSDKDVTS